MKKIIVSALAFSLVPFAAFAMPAVGDLVGTNPTDATAALQKAGCAVNKFEAEGGRIEAKCTDAANKVWEIYISPKTGKVTQIKGKD